MALPWYVPAAAAVNRELGSPMHPKHTAGRENTLRCIHAEILREQSQYVACVQSAMGEHGHRRQTAGLLSIRPDQQRRQHV